MADHYVNGKQTYKRLLPMIKSMGYETTMTANKIIVGTRKPARQRER
jgi:hypothetical protein